MYNLEKTCPNTGQVFFVKWYIVYLNTIELEIFDLHFP